MLRREAQIKRIQRKVDSKGRNVDKKLHQEDRGGSSRRERGVKGPGEDIAEGEGVRGGQEET